MKGQQFSRRRFLSEVAAAAGATMLSPVLVTFGDPSPADGAETIALTLPWIPEGEVAFMYVAQAKGFWKKRGLEVSITRGYGSGEAAKTVGLGQYHFGQADAGVSIT